MSLHDRVECFSEWPSLEEYTVHCNSFTPFFIQRRKTFQTNPFSMAAIAPTRIVDVSCSSTHEYHGNPMSRTKINMSFSEFLSIFQSSTTTASMIEEPNNLFLSQCCVYSTEKADIELPELESFAINEQPPIIPPKDLQSINLWANIQPSLSGLHYDANHNILLVFQGKKTLYLFPPSLTKQLQPICAYSETPNHSHLLPSEIMAQIKANQYKHDKITHGKSFPQPIIIQVEAGNALFIPEGWWHMVESTERTVALNYWFLSPLQKMLQQQAPHMTNYILRACVNALTSTSVNESLSIENNMIDSYCSSRAVLDDESSNSRERDQPSKKRSRLDKEQHHKKISVNMCEWWGEKLLPACATLTSFEDIWLPAAKKNAERLVKTVATNCTPEQAALILHQWDSYGHINTDETLTDENRHSYDVDSAKVAQCFDIFFSYLGDDKARLVHETLLSLQTIYRHQQGTQCVQSILGS